MQKKKGLRRISVGNKLTDIAIGTRKTIDVVMPKPQTGERPGLEEVTDGDLQEGRFVKLRRYSYTFRIDRNIEGLGGVYCLELVREDPPEGYDMREIRKLEDYIE